MPYKEVISGIYSINSASFPDRIYVGSAVNAFHRRDVHFSELQLNKHKNGKLQNHYNKYGVDDLSFNVIEQCDVAILIEREQYYIDTLKPYFNICPTAGSNLGVKWSAEVIKKFSDAHKGKVLSDSHKNNISMALKGKKKPEGFGANLSLQRTGNKLTEEHKQRLREGWKHRPPMSEATKQKISESSKGRVQSEASILKGVEARKGYKHSPETRQKISRILTGKYRGENSPNFGRKPSQLAIQHMKEGWVLRKIKQVQ